MFSLVLGQSFVFLEIVRIENFSQRQSVPIFTNQVTVGHDSVHLVSEWQNARRAQLIRDAPEIEVFDRTLGQILPFWNPLRFETAFHEDARYAAQAKVNCQGHANRASTHDDDLVPSLHCLSRSGRKLSPIGSGSLRFNSRRLDDRPPLLDLSLVIGPRASADSLRKPKQFQFCN